MDCSLGSFLLPFAKELGVKLPPLGFGLKGVTAISIDPSKYGNSVEGLSAVLYRSDDLRSSQFFMNVSWKGGLYGNRSLCGSRSASTIYGTWVSLVYHGKNKYREIAKGIFEGVERLKRGIKELKNYEVIGDPKVCSVAFRCLEDDKVVKGHKKSKKIFEIQSFLRGKEWQCWMSYDPEACLFQLTQDTSKRVDEFLRDLREADEEVTLDFKGLPLGQKLHFL